MVIARLILEAQLTTWLLTQNELYLITKIIKNNAKESILTAKSKVQSAMRSLEN